MREGRGLGGGAADGEVGGIRAWRSRGSGDGWCCRASLLWRLWPGCRRRRWPSDGGRPGGGRRGGRRGRRRRHDGLKSARLRRVDTRGGGEGWGTFRGGRLLLTPTALPHGLLGRRVGRPRGLGELDGLVRGPLHHPEEVFVAIAGASSAHAPLAAGLPLVTLNPPKPKPTLSKPGCSLRRKVYNRVFITARKRHRVLCTLTQRGLVRTGESTGGVLIGGRDPEC